MGVARGASALKKVATIGKLLADEREQLCCGLTDRANLRVRVQVKIKKHLNLLGVKWGG